MSSSASTCRLGWCVLTLLGPLAGGACADDPCADATEGSTEQPGALQSYLGDPSFPDDFWKTSTPEESNVDAKGLARAVGKIACTKTEVHSFVLARHGRILFEHYGWKSGSSAYDPDKTPHQTLPNERHVLHSTTKSFVSTLVGIAMGDGLIPGVEAPVVPYFPEYQPLPEPSPDKDRMTLEDLLTMRSGLKWNDAETDDADFADPALAVLSRPMVGTPGVTWNYSDGPADVTAALLRKVTGQTPLDYAKQKLFGPLGVTNVAWQASSNGTSFGGWGLELTPRDMARFGELYRNRGQWNGQQIVPADWTDAATSPKCDAGDAQYGYYFWIPNLPGFFCALGLEGQDIYISRELGLVAVFTANLSVSNASLSSEDLLRDFVIPAIR
jgi:CubicO group peptidase (beta-lactamase class C family)